MLIKFEDFLLERYSLPDSVLELSEEILYFILNKIKTWQNNKNSTLKIDTSLTPSKIREGFPVNKVKLRIELVECSSWKGFSSKSFTFEASGPLKPKLYDNKMVDLGLEFKFFLSKTTTNEEIIQNIEGNIYHEVLHSFQSFKKKEKGKSEKIDNINNFINSIRRDWYKSPNLSSFLRLSYATSTRKELDAFLASMVSTHSKVRYLKIMEEVFSITKEDLKRKILSEINDIKSFIRYVNKKASDSFYERRFKSFDDFFEFFYSNIIKRKKYLFRKISKI